MLATLYSVSKCSHYGRSFCHISPNAKMLVPHSVIDYGEVLFGQRDIEGNLTARHRTSVIDLSILRKLHRTYLKAIARESCFKKLDECNAYELRNFESFDVYMKHLKTAIFSHLLSLPNKLDTRTPRGNDDAIILNRCSNLSTDADDHVLIGRKLKVLRYEDEITYYLENDAAKLELAIVRFVSNVLQNERKFKLFKNPDTCNVFVLEGVVVDKLHRHAIHLLESFHALTGGASLASFCAVRVDTSTHKKFMPEHFFTCGRHYVPEFDSRGLFGVCQRTDVRIFVTTTTAEQMWSEFDTHLRWMTELYECFGLNFRVCFKRAGSLTLAESCRASIQLYSLREKKFIDVARLSVYDSFISHRLKILCHNANRESGLVHIIDGVVVSVPSLIACLLERSKDSLFIPDCLRTFMPK